MFSKIKLGYCPTKRDVFSREKAQKSNRIIREALSDFPVEVVDLTVINEEDLLFQGCDIQKIIDRFREQKIDALFFPHCNFTSKNRVA